VLKVKEMELYFPPIARRFSPGIMVGHLLPNILQPI